MQFALEYKVKQSKNGKFSFHCKLPQSILKRKFPSVHKPQKGPLKNISPGAYFPNFTVLFSLSPVGFGLVKIKVGAQAPRPSPLDPTVKRIIVTFAAKFS